MRNFSVAVALYLLTAVSSRIVTINQVTTAEPTTITRSESDAIITNQETEWISTTIFQASTLVTTIPTGIVNTEPVSSLSNPVKVASSISTGKLTQSIDPSTYSGSFTVVPSQEPSTIENTSKSETTTPSNAVKSSKSERSVEDNSHTATVVPASTSSRKSDVTTSPEGFVPSGSLTKTTSTELSSTDTSSAPTSSVPTSSASSLSAVASPTAKATGKYNGPIFNAISTNAPPGMFPREDLAISMPPGYDRDQICQTNKFYDNLLLGNYNLTSFTQPYGVFYSNDQNYYGVGISYSNSSQRVFGPDASAHPVEYYTNPLMLKSLVLSAKEFTVDDLEIPEVSAMGPFSANMTLKTKNCWPNQKLTVPLAIGSGFVTGIYDGYTPRLFSQLGISKIVKVHSAHTVQGLQKFVVTLMNGIQWNVYVKAPQGFEFKPVDDYEVMGNFASSGSESIVVQVAVVVSNEEAIDSAAGAFAVGASIAGETDSSTTTYRIAYEVVGESKCGTTLLYALPHHVGSFSWSSKQAVVDGLTVYSNTKGYLTGVLANALEMQESVANIPGWLTGSPSVLDSDSLKLLASTVNSELAEDISSQLDTSSTYGSGKTFDKFAYVCLVASEILQNDKVALEGLNNLKAAIEPYTQNKQRVNLIYDTLLKGITSSAANIPGGSPMGDYGSPYYNDHHFHYGYFVHTAAVIGYLDKKLGDGSWVSQNKDWINSMVRDVANPSSEDTFFPVSRMFDFYSGHSWAHGMFESGDGKDEESTSEDYNFAYGMKLWGRVIGDKEMEARGNLMLAIMKRTMNMYFLLKDDNSIQPPNYIANRVAGITFENKLDHTTYFGTNLEYIQGIHMIPLTPASVLIRDKTFVQQEWDSLLAPVIGNIHSGWTGILKANQAIIDPKASYDFFASNDFQNQYLDNGASRSWYLAFAALQGGAQ